jgi:hypothetical protein
MTEPIKTIADWIKVVEELETTFEQPECWPFPIPEPESSKEPDDES